MADRVLRESAAAMDAAAAAREEAARKKALLVVGSPEFWNAHTLDLHPDYVFIQRSQNQGMTKGVYVTFSVVAMVPGMQAAAIVPIAIDVLQGNIAEATMAAALLGAGPAWRLARGAPTPSIGVMASTGTRFAQNTGQFAAPSGAFSMGYQGRALTQAEVNAITAEFRAAGGVIDMGVDAQAYLRLRGAGGLTLNESTILLPAGPTRTAVFEELTHAGQFGRGVSIGAGQGGVLVFEGEAAEILIRNRHLWQLPNSEVRQVIQNLRDIRAELQRLGVGK
jgi:hypothetical protein